MPAPTLKDSKEEISKSPVSFAERKFSAESSHELIRDVEKEAQEHLESRLQSGESEINVLNKSAVSADLQDFIKSPDEDASSVAAKGSTIVLPISQSKFEAGKKVEDTGRVVDKSILGTASIIGLVTEVSRLIQKAHKFSKRIIFRKETN